LAVAIEFVNVIVRKSAVELSFPGGLDGFARQDIPNLTEDAHLLRVGFMGGSDAFGFVSELQAAGLRYLEMDAASDIAVIWSGSAVPPWLSVGAVNGYSACWASDHPVGELAWSEPGFLLRCPRAVYNSLAQIVGQCGAEAVAAESGTEPGYLARLRCVRGGAEIEVDVVGERDSDSPVGLWGRRQLARRSQFRADVALIRDLVAALLRAGAKDA
jgi:hypothetical protein